jgi:cytochrome c553
VIPALALAVLLLGATPGVGGTPAAATPAPAKAGDVALASGKLPDDPARALLEANCVACHSVDYVTQQRLTEKQWQAEVQKMRKFGAPLGDDEAAALAGYLGRNWPADLAERRPAPVPAPKGSLPGR